MTALTDRPTLASRPTGSSFVSLVMVELRRVWWRRMTKVALAAVAIICGVAVFGAYQATTPETIARQLENYNEMVRSMEQQKVDMPGIIAQCEKDQAAERTRTGDQTIDFRCQEQGQGPTPSLADFGIQNPAQDVLTSTLSKSVTPFIGFAAIALGASLVAAEFATGAMGTWLTFSPRRLRVAAAKLIGSAASGALLAGVGFAVIALGSWLVATINRPDGSLKIPDAVADAGDPTGMVILRCLGVIALGALGGGALALLLRHTAAVLGAVLGGFIVSSMLLSMPFLNQRYNHLMPETNLTAVIDRKATYYETICSPDGGCNGIERTVTAGAGWTYFLVIAAVALVAGVASFRHRDVS